MEKTFHEKIVELQSRLNVPKGQYNSFGEFYYRSCSDILTALKPMLAELGMRLEMDDEVVYVGNRHYVKATVTLTDGKEQTVNAACAREDESRPKMAGAQLTGGASSYARKYALCGLLAIDDERDPDTDEAPKPEKKTVNVTNVHNTTEKPKPTPKSKEDNRVSECFRAIKKIYTRADGSPDYGTAFAELSQEMGYPPSTKLPKLTEMDEGQLDQAHGILMDKLAAWQALEKEADDIPF